MAGTVAEKLGRRVRSVRPLKGPQPIPISKLRAQAQFKTLTEAARIEALDSVSEGAKRRALDTMSRAGSAFQAADALPDVITYAAAKIKSGTLKGAALGKHLQGSPDGAMGLRPFPRSSLSGGH